MAAGTHWEVESTFDVSGDTPLPDLTLSGELATRETVVHRLSATYYDTEDLVLTRAQITLRRRVGGKDDGWHVKLPAVETSAGSTGRLELSFELGDGATGSAGFPEVPEEARHAVYGRVRDAPLVPIARVDNERHETIIETRNGENDENGEHPTEAAAPFAEFCDDHVDGSNLLTGSSTSWREWEIELVDPDAADAASILERLSGACTEVGAEPAALASKLRTALGPLPEQDRPASSPIADMLSTDVERLVAGDPGTRLGHEVGVHSMRTAARNLLSTLSTYTDELQTAADERALTTHAADGGAVPRPDIAGTVDELRQLLRMLGKSRDVYVVRKRLLELADDYPRDLVPDSVRTRIERELLLEDERAFARIDAALTTPRYIGLLDALDMIVAVASDPAFGAGSPSEREVRTGRRKEIVTAGKPASKAEAREMALKGAERQFRRFDKARMRVEDELASLDLTLAQREELTHTLRKRNKALRRSAAAISEKSTPKVVPLRMASERLHTVLGDVQDSVTARQWLRRIARRAEVAGEPTFGFGVLFEHERGESERTLDGFAEDAATVASAFRELQSTRKAARKAARKNKREDRREDKRKGKKKEK
ncbi:CYTH and CHAD domain-containing protein [Dietzia sp.]|uniref:CYTH and CHAD domain-containing protein n=1 Tax=Dietzia sp. TaxID=1871616 RepID=UPI002FDB3268